MNHTFASPENVRFFAYGCLLDGTLLNGLTDGPELIDMAWLPRWRVVFSHVAFLVPDEGGQAFGAMFKIPARDLTALDWFEGRAYRRTLVRPRHAGSDDETKAIAYVARDAEYVRRFLSPPPETYLNKIYEAYDVLGAPPRARRDLVRAQDAAEKALERRRFDRWDYENAMVPDE